MPWATPKAGLPSMGQLQATSHKPRTASLDSPAEARPPDQDRGLVRWVTPKAGLPSTGLPRATGHGPRDCSCLPRRGEVARGRREVVGRAVGCGMRDAGAGEEGGRDRGCKTLRHGVPQATGHRPRTASQTPTPALPLCRAQVANHRRSIGYKLQATGHEPRAARSESPDEAAPPPRSGVHAGREAGARSLPTREHKGVEAPYPFGLYRMSIKVLPQATSYRPRPTGLSASWHRLGGPTGPPLRGTSHHKPQTTSLLFASPSGGGGRRPEGGRRRERPSGCGARVPG